MVALIAIYLAVAGFRQEVHSGATTSAKSPNQCVQRDGLTFKGVGLWTRLPTGLSRYGQPLRIEPIGDVNKERVYGNYIYKDIKFLIFNSIVWQIDVLTPDISIRSGIRLLGAFSEVEKMLGVKLRNPSSNHRNGYRHKVPICPPDPPEVEEYVILGFDQDTRLVDFTVEGVFP